MDQQPTRRLGKTLVVIEETNSLLMHFTKTSEPTDCDPCAVTGPRAGEVPPRKLLAAGHATSPQERGTHLSPMKTHIGRESDGEMTYLRDSGTQIIHFVTLTVFPLYPLIPLPSPLICRYQGEALSQLSSFPAFPSGRLVPPGRRCPTDPCP